MCKLYIERCAGEIELLAVRLDWTVVEKRVAETGSTYLELRRDEEWLTVRVSDHRQVYHKWMTTYSVAPGDLFYEQIEIILGSPYGTVGDVIEGSIPMEEDAIKIVGFREKNTVVFYPCRYPYGKADVIEEGVPYEKWLEYETIGAGTRKEMEEMDKLE